MEKGRFQQMVEETIAFDKKQGYVRTMDIPVELQNLAYLALCVAGEAGEIADDTKKMIRDGVTPERLANLKKEVVDVSIYLAKMIDTLEIDFDQVWVEKHKELEGRSYGRK